MNHLLRKPCPHCGCTAQIYLEYHFGWEATCYQCGCIFPIPANEIPPELDKRKYSVPTLQSDGIPQGNFPKFMTRSE
jgi:hypothetical protein